MKIKWLFIVIAAFLTCLFSCASKPQGPDELDLAIRDISNYLNSNVPSESKIIILNIASSNTNLSEYIIDELISNAVNDKVFTVVDRHQLDAIRAEQNFQLSGEVADEQALRIGQFFGAQTIVSGNINSLGQGHRIRVRALNVETAVVQGQFNRNIASSGLISLLASSPNNPQQGNNVQRTQAVNTANTGTTSHQRGTSANILNVENQTGDMYQLIVAFPNNSSTFVVSNGQTLFNGEIRANSTIEANIQRLDLNRNYRIAIFERDIETGNVLVIDNIRITAGMTLTFNNSHVARERVKAYMIGDIGPAGGLIFYDKGNNSGGWRYLEVAPRNVEFQAPWSVGLGGVSDMVRDTQGSIGSGKQNTRLILQRLRAAGGQWESAAIKIAELEINGFNDWFLPSMGEMDQIYGNLSRRNLGNFINGWYWSSTESRTGPDLHWGTWMYNLHNGESQVAAIGWNPSADPRSRRQNVRPIREVPGPSR